MKNVYILLVLLFVLSACIENNPTPSWIKVHEWTLNENIALSGEEGELTHNFTEAWVYVDNDLMGVFEVPFKIPILHSGEKSVRIYPAIKNNGISATKKRYPFCTTFETTANLIQGDTVEFFPQTQYKSSTDFWIEDFENATHSFISDNPSATNLTIESDPATSNRYGKVFLNESADNWAAYTPFISIPLGEIYLEVDYYNTNKIVTGLIAGHSDGTTEYHVNIAMNPQEDNTVHWKKIYIDLAELAGASGGDEFSQAFKATLDNGDTEGLIYIDNVKVVY